MDVRARISGLTAEVRVRQTYRNSLSEALEATYIFPLPDRAAVTAFRMEVAGRIVEGDLKERGEAREEYEKAIEAGHRAAIAEEERSGTFSLRVGNIPAKEQVTIELTLVGPVAVADGEATFRFPLGRRPALRAGHSAGRPAGRRRLGHRHRPGPRRLAGHAAGAAARFSQSGAVVAGSRDRPGRPGPAGGRLVPSGSAPACTAWSSIKGRRGRSACSRASG